MTLPGLPISNSLERPAPGLRDANAEFETSWQGPMDSLMDQITDHSNLEREPLDEPARPRRRMWRTVAVGAAVAIGLFAVYLGFGPHKGNQAVALPTPAPAVTVSQPLQRE